jgi:hypothetical protein
LLLRFHGVEQQSVLDAKILSRTDRLTGRNAGSGRFRYNPDGDLPTGLRAGGCLANLSHEARNVTNPGN